MFELRKIGFIKRASALLLDAILLAVLTTGFMWIISLICNFQEQSALSERYMTEWYDYQKDCIPTVAEHYGFDYTVTYDEGGVITESSVTKDGVACGIEDILPELVRDMADACDFTFTQLEEGGYTLTAPDGSPSSLTALADALQELEEGERPAMSEMYLRYAALTPLGTVNRQRDLVNSMLIMMISVGLLLSYLILEFILPIIFKNGQTVGKKVFSICLVRPDCVRITTLSLFARTFLGKYAVETMFPVLLIFMLLSGNLGMLAIILFAAITILNIILYFATKNHTPIHDIFAYTVAADMKEQMIFASEEELNQMKAELQREAVQREKNI